MLAEGRWPSSAGLMVTDGIGWKPSSEAGRAGDPEIESTTLQFLMPRTDVKKSFKLDYFDKFSTEILNADTSQLALTFYFWIRAVVTIEWLLREFIAQACHCDSQDTQTNLI